MTLKELLQKVDIEQVLPIIAQWYYPEDPAFTQEQGYRDAYAELINMPVEEVPEDCVNMANCENSREIWVEKSHFQNDENSRHLPRLMWLEGEIRARALGKTFVFKDDVEVTDEELAAMSLWHITYYAYTEAQAELTMRKWMKQAENGRTYTMVDKKGGGIKFVENIPNVDKDALRDWTERTAKGYAAIAKEAGEKGLGIYTLPDLTKLNAAPDVMVVGINPSMKETYEAREEWGFWKRLKGYFRKVKKGNPLDDESKFVLTHFSFFGTQQANCLSEDLLKKTLLYTIELISIVKPKRIVFLGGKRIFEKIEKAGKVNEDFLLEYFPVEGEEDCFIGEIEGIRCLGVPYPSAHLSAEKRNRIMAYVAKQLRK